MAFRKSFLLIFIVLVSLLLIFGCTAKVDKKKVKLGVINFSQAPKEKPVEQQPVEQPNKSADKEPIANNNGFKFGIEYAVPGLAMDYSKTGAHAAKPTPELVIWKNIQKSKNAPYDWSAVDSHVKEYQQAGFDYMQILITAESGWASMDTSAIFPKDTRPKPEYEQDYVDFVKGVVERYDKDNIDDMPGLLYPINYWGIEREFTGFFPGSGSEYVQVLKLAYPAVKEANPNAKVMLNALLMWDIFQGSPSDAEIEKRMQNPLNRKRKDISDVPILLDAYNYFDVVDLHLLGDYSEIKPTVKWIKKELEKRSTSKEIYGGDVFPMSPLLAYGLETCSPGIIGAKELYPVTAKTRCEASKLIESMRKKNDPNHQKAMEWLEKNNALNLVKKYVVAADEGLSGMNIGNLEDWPIPFGAGTASNMGMMDTTHPFGNQLVIVRTPVEERPAFYALKTIVSYLDGFDSVKQLDIGSNIYAYEFTRSSKKIIVAWYDDAEFYGLDAKTPEITAKIPWDKKEAIIIETPTERNKQEGKSSKIAADKDYITISLGYIPVFIS